MTWTFSLVTLIFRALPLQLQEDVLLGDYILHDLSTIISFLSQEQELQNLR